MSAAAPAALVGQRVGIVRRQRGLTATALAVATTMRGAVLTAADLDAVEAGERELSFREAVALARVLDVALRWLGGDEAPAATVPGVAA